MILIGELRDSETAETALQAAESGHLVLSTMHTVDASETLGRLVEFFPAIKQPQVRSILAGVLKGVVSQRLLPRVDGGRVAAVEVMVANSRIQELIRENKPEFVPEAIAEGAFFQMQTLTQGVDRPRRERRRRRGDRSRGRSEPPRLHDRARPRAQGARGPESDAARRTPSRKRRRPCTTPRAAGRERSPHRLMRIARPVEHVSRWARVAACPTAAEAQDGFTLTEMLVVLAILGIVLAGLTQLFTSRAAIARPTRRTA